MNQIVALLCLGAMLVCCAASVMMRSTLKSAVALAIVSVALGIMMFVMGSTWAGLFEISVCSGFVTVIFISAVTMTSEEKQEQDKLYEQKKHTSLLPVFLIFGGVLLIALMMYGGFELPFPATMEDGANDFQHVLWKEHRGLLWAQLAALLAGVFAVIVLFKEEKKQ